MQTTKQTKKDTATGGSVDPVVKFVRLNAPQKEALDMLIKRGDWISVYDFCPGEISGHTLNALVRKNLAVSKPHLEIAGAKQYKAIRCSQ